MPKFAIQRWESHNDLEAVDGSLNLWFTIDITGPPSETYPVLVEFLWPNGSSTMLTEPFHLPFGRGGSRLDLRADLENVRGGNHVLRLTVDDEQLEDIRFSVKGGPSITRMVLKAKVVDTGQLLATVITPDTMYGDTRFQFFDLAGPEPLSEVEVARRFAALYANHEEGRKLNDCKPGDPFPDVACTDSLSGVVVTLELTQLAYEGWQTTQSHARRLKSAIAFLLVGHRPKYRERAMILYFNRENGRTLLPNPQSSRGKSFLQELDEALARGLWAVHETPPDDSGKSLRTETLHAGSTLSTFHQYLRNIELGPNVLTDPRLTSSDDPLILLHSEKVVVEGEFSRLVKQAVNRKLKKGTAYTADILLIHNAVDPHVLVAAEDDDEIDLARRAVADTKVDERFDEVWLFDIWENSIFKLNKTT